VLGRLLGHVHPPDPGSARRSDFSETDWWSDSACSSRRRRPRASRADQAPRARSFVRSGAPPCPWRFPRSPIGWAGCDGMTSWARPGASPYIRSARPKDLLPRVEQCRLACSGSTPRLLGGSGKSGRRCFRPSSAGMGACKDIPISGEANQGPTGCEHGRTSWKDIVSLGLGNARSRDTLLS
jgi:hypothetical protein